jgi:transposase
MHLAWRWFTGLGFDQEIPHHSTFSKNRHGRFQESKLFEQLFEQIVRQCVEVGLVQGKDLSVDGSFVEANAAKESRIPREADGLCNGEAMALGLGSCPVYLSYSSLG